MSLFGWVLCDIRLFYFMPFGNINEPFASGARVVYN